MFLSNNRVAVFSFNSTLAIHGNKNYVGHKRGSDDYFICNIVNL